MKKLGELIKEIKTFLSKDYITCPSCGMRIIPLSFSLSESSSYSLQQMFSRLVSLALGISDSASKGLTARRINSLSFSMNDASDRTFTGTRASVESLSLSDETLKSLLISRLITLGFNMADAVSMVYTPQIEMDYTYVLSAVLDIYTVSRVYIQEWVEQTDYDVCAVLWQIGDSKAYLCVYSDATWKVFVEGVEL